MLTSKIVIAVLILGIVLLVLFLLGRKSVSAEVSVAAPADKVWALLTDISAVKEWNSVLIPVDGELKEGGKILYEFYQDEGGKVAKMEAWVKSVEELGMLNQTGGMTGVLTFDHKYLLQPTEGGCVVRIEEEYRGIMVPFWNPDPVEKAYGRLLIALKARVENLANTP